MKINNIGVNRTELITDSMVIFFSYDTPVAACIDGKYYATKKRHSITTARHINEYIGKNYRELKDQSFFDKLIA